MGTLFNQQPRMDYFHGYGVKFIGTVKELAKKNDDYDRKDEQLAGIGELIKEMNEQIMGLGEGLSAISER
ncbi:hypothetical protein, partial [Bacillus cereus group sp. BfR-BA-01393]|uniref:hypothetical protein n=1 Tax=Bacillus cereus group sp. BfR-BA-01393 TaxID=2920330 RepID=UPI001F56383B